MDGVTEETYTVEIKLDGNTVKTLTVTAGTPGVEVTLTGTGTQKYEIWIRGQLFGTQEVDFTTNG